MTSGHIGMFAPRWPPIATSLLVAVLSSACSGATEGASEPASARSGAAAASTSAGTESAPPSGSPSAAVAGPSAPSAAEIRDSWVEVDRRGEPGGWEHVTSVVHGDAGFLATASRVEGGHGGPGEVHRQLLVSPDGTDWRSVEYPGAVEFPERPSFVEPYVAADGRYVLLGSGRSADLVSSIAAFASRDGEAWEPVEMTGLAPDVVPWDIAIGARGYLLLDVSGADNQPTLWLSSDGLHWEAVYEFSGSQNSIGNVAAGPEGFVVVGFRWLAHPEHQTFALASGDGRTWEETVDFVDHVSEEIVTDPRVGSFGTGWVATTRHPDDRTSFWTSEDGIVWERAGEVSHGEIGFNGPVLEDHDALLYFNPNAGRNSPTPGTWVTRDGISWEVLHETEIVSDIASADGVTVIVGSEWITAEHSQAVIWRDADD